MFQSTHSLRSATAAETYLANIGNVSIHALLAECDISFSHPSMPTIGFNPRTPCGVRLCYHIYKYSVKAFQSTHSLRSATLQNYLMENSRTVSIHALLAECDEIIKKYITPYTMFQSTHSLRSATFLKLHDSRQHVVSIHALLAECDYTSLQVSHPQTSFNPRTPCGVRRARLG